VAKLVHRVEHVAGVRGVHDVHVWTISSGMVACSCHVVVDDLSVKAGQGIQRAVTQALERDFGITHATVQIEVEGCGVTDLHCEMRKAATADAHGHGCGHAHGPACHHDVIHSH
jgi:cobalt-zinc-cadmium efflux system protein